MYYYKTSIELEDGEYEITVWYTIEGGSKQTLTEPAYDPEVIIEDMFYEDGCPVGGHIYNLIEDDLDLADILAKHGQD